MATLDLQPVIELLQVAKQTGISIPVLKQHLRRVGEQGIRDHHLTTLHRSGLDTDLYEAEVAGTLPKDRDAFRRHLGLPPKDEGVAPIPSATFTIDTTHPSWPPEWPKNKGLECPYHRPLGDGVVVVLFHDGEAYINGVQVVEWLSPKQEKGDAIGGENLAKLRDAEATKHPDLPDAVVDLVRREQDNPAVAAWLAKRKGPLLFCFATRYKSPGGRRRVRCLYRRDDGRWVWSRRWLDHDFDRRSPALVLERPLSA